MGKRNRSLRPAAANARSKSVRDSEKSAHPSKCSGTMVAREKVWAAITASRAPGLVGQRREEPDHRSPVAIRRAGPGGRCGVPQHPAIRCGHLFAFPRRQADGPSAQTTGARDRGHHPSGSAEQPRPGMIEVVEVVVVTEQHQVNVTQGLGRQRGGLGLAQDVHRRPVLTPPGSKVGSVRSRRPPTSSNAVGPPLYVSRTGLRLRLPPSFRSCDGLLARAWASSLEGAAKPTPAGSARPASSAITSSSITALPPCSPRGRSGRSRPGARDPPPGRWR